MNGERRKATAKLVRLLTNHAPIGEFRDRFNLDGPRVCHACELKVLDTREHMVYECNGWTHGLWDRIPRDNNTSKALSHQSRHRIQSIAEVIEGQRSNIVGQIAVGQAPVRDAMNFVDDEELAEQQALLNAYDLRLHLDRTSLTKEIITGEWGAYHDFLRYNPMASTFDWSDLYLQQEADQANGRTSWAKSPQMEDISPHPVQSPITDTLDPMDGELSASQTTRQD